MRLVLADTSGPHLQMLRGYLEMSFSDQIQLVMTSQSGQELLSALEGGLEADLIVTDFFLRDMDAGTLYAEIKEMTLPRKPQILCAVEKQNEWQTNRLLSLGLECYIIKPYHMENLFEQALSMCGMASLELEEQKVLTACGFTEHRMVPFLYTVYALNCIESFGQTHPLAKEIYHQIAAREHVTPSAVESALRRASKYAFECMTPDYQRMCRNSGKCLDHPLGNGAFLEMLVQEIHRDARLQ